MDNIASMVTLIAHKTRLHPNNKQAAFFRQCAGFRRFAYNWALAEVKREYESNEVSLKISDADKRFNAIKKEQFPWSYDMPSCVGQVAIKYDLKSGMQNFFRRVKQGGGNPGFPRFKRKGTGDSFTFTNVVVRDKHIAGIRLELPKKMGSIRLGDAIRFEGRLMSTTISRRGERWYASFLIECPDEISYPKAKEGTAIGVDVGVAHYAALSDGQLYPPSGALAKYRKRLTKAQRKLSRMQGPEYKKGIKASENWKKQSEKVRKIHRNIAQLRENYSHQVTTGLANRFELIAIENLKVSNMTRSSKGDEENPGKNVSQKSGLNRSILDGGFHQFRSMLEYKVARRGGTVIAVNPAYTSQTCPACNHKSADNRKTRDKFECVECGHSGHADIVAANNILLRATQPTV